jgi:hypothetical protein
MGNREQGTGNGEWGTLIFSRQKKETMKVKVLLFLCAKFWRMKNPWIHQGRKCE